MSIKNVMEPGRDLDALIAEKVMGYSVFKNHKGGWSLGPADYYDVHGSLELFNPLPSYSGDIAAAWEVIEKVQASTEASSFSLRQDHEGLWRCDFMGSGKKPFYAIALNQNTATLAICIAALNTVE